jgi:predicted kinase
MAENNPTLYLVSGKIASGKSMLARTLASRPATVLISKDYWLSNLYPVEIATIEDYVKYADRLRGVVGGHAESLLRNGVAVVLDFPANTRGLRKWMRGIFEGAGAHHELHYFDVSDDVCKERLKQRNKEGAHEFTPSDDEFDRMTAYFEPPTAEEGFNLTVHT